MKVLITGAAGQVGFELTRALAHWRVVAVVREALDLTDLASVERAVMEVRPDVLINAAAYTAVDKAEAEFAAAHAVNAVAPGVLAQCMRRLGGLLVHYSTDYVFDGSKASAYGEDDAPHPLSVYGASKLAGEQAILESGATHLVFRTAWVYDLRGRNFLNTIRRLASERPELRVVADQFGAPTWSRWIARTTAQVLQACLETDSARERVRSEWSGVYHMTAGGRTSWHGFASAIVEQLAERGLTTRVPVTAIGTADYPTPAQRPANSVLSNDKLRRTFGIQQVDWREQLQDCLAEA
jgi:dTDP-4-dehydrorhamnose reductase